MLILPATLCRAAWLGALGGCIVVVMYKFDIVKKTKNILHSNLKRILAFALITSLLLITAFYLHHFKSSSADGRMLIWEITANKIKEKPIQGIGLGRFQAEYNNWQANWFSSGNGSVSDKMIAGNVKFAYSEYLEITSEIGLIGLLIFLFLVGSILKTGLINKKKKIESSNLEVVGNFALIFSLIISSFFSYPMHSLPSLLLLFVALAIFSEKVYLNNYNLNLGLNIKYIVGISMVLIAIISFKYKSDEYVNYKKWNYAYYGESNAINSNFSELYPYNKYNGEFLLEYGKVLEMNKMYTQSSIILEKAKNIYSDPYLYITLGECYNANKNFQKAEQMYLFASNMIPHKIYAKYKLAKLYDQNNLSNKALHMSKSILQMPIKVKSTAVEEMFNDLKIIINKYEEKKKPIYLNNY